MSSISTSLPFPFPVVTWQDNHVVLLDQTLLPDEISFRDCKDIPTLCHSIVELAVRGAPAIGVAAGYGLAMAWRLAMEQGGSVDEMLFRFQNDRRQLAATRPTAVNLFWALDRVARLAEKLVAAGSDAQKIAESLLSDAEAILSEDIAMCRAMGHAGANLLGDNSTILTHCNAGGLATGGYGTAVGVVFAAKEQGKSIHVFADETRPLLQGARLTAWELANQGIDVTVICDSAAATVISRGLVDAVITGADRVTAAGDAANKIGTYPLAVLARRHGVPFYVAAPASTFDPGTLHGIDVVIEERDPDEVHQFRSERTTPPGVKAWNPAFDVTPGELITAFITEHGVLEPPFAQSLGPVLDRSD